MILVNRTLVTGQLVGLVPGGVTLMKASNEL